MNSAEPKPESASGEPSPGSSPATEAGGSQSGTADAGRTTSRPESPKLGAPSSSRAAAPAKAAEPPIKRTPRGGKAAILLSFVAIAIAVGAAVAAWRSARSDAMTLARRVQDVSQQLESQATRLSQALDRARSLNERLTAAEGRLAEAASQQSQLEKLYRAMSAESTDSVLADAEGSLSLAAQQLASGGSTQGALLALQAVEMRMARLDDAALLGVRRAISRDAERLRSESAADVGAIAGRLDLLATVVDTLPLLAPVSGAASAQEAAPAGAIASRDEAGWWPSWLRLDAFRHELAGLFRVRRVEGADPVLVSPAQEYFLRENLRLLLLNARLSLLSRNDPLFRRDLDRAGAWLQRYFDRGAKPVQDALGQLAELSASRATDVAPSISESVAAVRAARAAREGGR